MVIAEIEYSNWGDSGERINVLSRPQDKSVLLKILFFLFLNKTYGVGTQKNRLIETVLLTTPAYV